MSHFAFLSLLLLASGQASQTAAPPPPACAAAEHRQFDFWVGSWEVFVPGGQRPVARSQIESLYGGCAIREHWMPNRGTAGGSLNAYLPGRQIWRQTWVDAANSYVVFEGRFENETMVLSGTWQGLEGPGTAPLVRIHWTREPAGAVRQRGEISRDSGATWGPLFDFLYRRSNS